MVYEDFSKEHYKQLIKEKEEWNKERKALREQLSQKDDLTMEKDNLIYKQNIRLKNYDETATKVQQTGGSIVGLLNKLRINK